MVLGSARKSLHCCRAGFSQSFEIRPFDALVEMGTEIRTIAPCAACREDCLSLLSSRACDYYFKHPSFAAKFCWNISTAPLSISTERFAGFRLA